MKRSALVCVLACSLILAIGLIVQLSTALAAGRGGRPSKPPGKPALTADEATILEMIDPTRLNADIAACESFGQKTVGSAAEDAAMDHFTGVLAGILGAANVFKVPFDSQKYEQFFDTNSVRACSPDCATDPAPLAVDSVVYGLVQGTYGSLNNVPYSFANQPDGKTLVAQIVNGGNGAGKDFRNIDVSGKIVLLARNDYSTFWPSIAIEEARQHGAIATVTYSDPAFSPTSNELIRQDSVGAEIPSFTINRNDGYAIRDRIANGPVTVELKGRVDMVDYDQGGRSHNISGFLPGPTGGPRSDEYALLSTHLDTWFTGANDDCAGVAIVVEAARVYVEAMNAGLFTPDRTMIFNLVGAEELGGPIESWFDWLSGSYNFFLQNNEPGGIVRKAVGTVNNDLPAHPGPKTMDHTAEAGGLANAVFKAIESDAHLANIYGLLSFVDGYIYGPVFGGSVLQVWGYAGAFFPAAYHTTADTLSNPAAIDQDRLLEAAKFNVLASLRMHNNLFNPIDIGALVNWSTEELARDRGLALSDLDGAQANALAGAFDDAVASLAQLKAEYDRIAPTIGSLKSEFGKSTTSEARKAEIRQQADPINAALRDARYTVSRYLWGTGSTLGGWISMFRTLQHGNDLAAVNAALAKLGSGKNGQPSAALEAMKAENFLQWSHKFSRGTFATMQASHQFGPPTTSACSGILGPEELPEVIQQWGGEWDQQQEYVFLYDAYKALESAVAARQPTPKCVKTDLSNAQLDLVNFLVDDLENIRAKADAATAILSGV